MIQSDSQITMRVSDKMDEVSALLSDAQGIIAKKLMSGNEFQLHEVERIQSLDYCQQVVSCAAALLKGLAVGELDRQSLVPHDIAEFFLDGVELQDHNDDCLF